MGLAERYVFYLKMKGDYIRYNAEISKHQSKQTGDATQINKDKSAAQQAYQDAKEVSDRFLTATSPTRLGLALNYSVCYYEILEDSKQACNLAKAAFDEAIQKL